MGLISGDRRPRDWAYMATFDKKDLPSLEEMARHIRETHDTNMIEDFNLKCEQKLAGEPGPIILNNGVELKTVTKTGDLALNTGLQQCINIIIGTSATRWSHFGMSSGSTPLPAITDTALLTENIAHRVSLAWAESIGMRLFFGGISSQTLGSAPANIGEIGVYNGSSAGAVLLNRTLFLNNAAITSYTDGIVSTAPIIISAVLAFCPVT